MPNTVRLHRGLAMASPDGMTAIGDWLYGRCWAGSGQISRRLIRPSSTHCRQRRRCKADTRSFEYMIATTL